MTLAAVAPASAVGLRLAQGFDALSAALFLIVIALGLYIIFGIMRVINMAHGELFMLGAYSAWWLQTHGINFWFALVLAPIMVGALGLLIERTIIRSLYPRGDLSTLLATAGLSILLQQLVSLILGPSPQSVNSPLNGNIQILGQSYLDYQIVASALALLVIVAIFALIGATSFGVRVRATMEDPAMAQVFGINAARMNMLAFSLGAALAGFAGALMAPLLGLTPTMGLDFVVRSFLVVILGGVGAMVGTVMGGAVVGGGHSLLTAALNGTLADLIILAFVMVLVVVRPQGISGRRR